MLILVYDVLRVDVMQPVMTEHDCAWLQNSYAQQWRGGGVVCSADGKALKRWKITATPCASVVMTDPKLKASRKRGRRGSKDMDLASLSTNDFNRACCMGSTKQK